MTIRVLNSNTIGGAALALFGTGYLWEAARYSMGTARNMGAGYFPVLIGGLIIIVGGVLILRGAFQPGERLRFPIRPTVAISISIGIFGLLINALGLVAAIGGAVFVAALAEPKPPFLRTAALALFLIVLSWAVFVEALGMPMRLVRWP